MRLESIICAWLALNYLVMARLAYLAARREGASAERAAGLAAGWPVMLFRLRI